MKLIAHRGNVKGPNPNLENSVNYLDKAIYLGFDVEVDVWKISENYFFGHDYAQYKIDFNWIKDNNKKLWIHCKNLEALSFFSKTSFNFFWHQKDSYTLTSKGYIWVYPNTILCDNSVCVLPELGYKGDINMCSAICTDYPEKWLNYV